VRITLRHLASVAVVLLLTVATAQTQPAAPAASAQLIDELRAGGYVLAWRHPRTHPDQADTNPFDLSDCSRQRQLDDQGREFARATGAALRARNVSIGRIISSPFCRAQEAARLTGLGNVEVSNDIAEGGLVVSPNENNRRAAAMRTLFATAPAAGTNTLIVSHRPNIMDALGRDFFDLAEGEIVVLRPTADAPGFRVVGRIRPGALTLPQ
jgi:phosphohistidine phosphatase SixA